MARIALGVALGLASVAVTSFEVAAHPTDREILDTMADRRACEASARGEDGASIDSMVRLGMTEAELRASVAGLERDSSASVGEEDDLQRWVLEVSGDPSRGSSAGVSEVSEVQYELWLGRLYRIRWRLAPSFERPIFDELVARGELCLGPVDLDQTFEAEPGSSDATLRRARWTHGDLRIELRQLHPLAGGPVYLSATDSRALREMGAAGRAPFPSPSQTAPWWMRSARVPEPPTAQERKRLGQRFLRLIGDLSHRGPEPESA